MKALCESSPQARCHFTRLDQVEQLVRASDRVTADNFRRKVLRELVKIKTAWPDLNYSTAKGVLILWPSKPTIAPSRGIAQSQAYPSPVPRPRIAPRWPDSSTKRHYFQKFSRNKQDDTKQKCFE